LEKHLLILDLDETLVFATEQPLDRPADFGVAQYSVYPRPFLAEFLQTVSGWYELAVWSSGSPSYVADIVGQVFPQRDALRFVWASDRCTVRFDPELRDYYWIKDLKKVKRAGYRLERVLMLDDTPSKLERQYGNLLRVRPFFGDPADTELQEVLPFLDRLWTEENLRHVEKRNWRNAMTAPEV
jgi:RNA polymerase II subunit A small phosphatase-like protein